MGIGCVFVFDGLQFGVEDSQNRVRNDSRRADSARAFEQAWDLYDQQQADQVVDAFSNAGAFVASNLGLIDMLILLNRQPRASRVLSIPATNSLRE